jgi:hypothetical protein
MKNMEVLHTLRLYDADFIAKLGALLEREKNHYRNKNEFMTALLKQGYASYTAAVKKADGAGTAASVGEANAFKESVKTAAADGEEKGIYALLTEMNEYMTLQFKVMSLYQEIYQKMLAAIYRMQLSLAGGEKVMQANVEAGFFDDLPVRFEKVIFHLKTQFGLA